MSAATFSPWYSVTETDLSGPNAIDQLLLADSSSSVPDQLLPCVSDEDWQYALSRVREAIYTSTGAGIPSPVEYYIMKNKALTSTPLGKTVLKEQYLHRFNGVYDLSDLSVYRRMRSENLFLRMINCGGVGVDRSTLLRLGNGVFVQTKWEPSTPRASSMLPTIKHDQDISDPDDFLNLLQQTVSASRFIPYSYTFGARYTDPYGNASDVLVRGHIPVWCQTLFLSECVRQMPIRANETRAGLFPFAPEVIVTFRPMTMSDYDADPELTLCYERFAMELSEPDMLFGEDEETWAERKQRVLQKMLYCEIPDDLAQSLTDRATAWATAQGYIL